MGRRAPMLGGVLGLALLFAGCGKSNLTASRAPSPVLARQSAGVSTTAPAGTAPAKTPVPRAPAGAQPRPESAPLPTPAQANAFGAAVNLVLADLPGARAQKRTPGEESNRASEECATARSAAIGGAESPRFTRGKGLAKELISSGVAVLHSPRAAERELLSVTSLAGIRCYAKVVKRGLTSKSSGLKLADLHVSRRQLAADGVHGTGIRIALEIRSKKGGLGIPVYIDALVFTHGRAEIELFASSYVQPEPEKTEQELLSLMAARADKAQL